MQELTLCRWLWHHSLPRIQPLFIGNRSPFLMVCYHEGKRKQWCGGTPRSRYHLCRMARRWRMLPVWHKRTMGVVWRTWKRCFRKRRCCINICVRAKCWVCISVSMPPNCSNSTCPKQQARVHLCGNRWLLRRKRRRCHGLLVWAAHAAPGGLRHSGSDRN